MRDHWPRGYHILRKIPFLSQRRLLFTRTRSTSTAGAIRARLRGSEIPIGARIVAIAATLDALTSDRPYRKARTFDAARQEILRCSGSQFDPAVVETFLKKSSTSCGNELRAEINGEHRQFSTFDLSSAPILRAK